MGIALSTVAGYFLAAEVYSTVLAVLRERFLDEEALKKRLHAD